MVWQTHPRVRRPQVPNSERPTSVSSQATAREKLLPDSDLDTCTAHMRLHQTYWATWKLLLSSLVPAHSQASRCLDQASSRRHPWTQGLPGSPHTALPFSRGPPDAAVTLLLPGHLEWFTLCCLRFNILPEWLHAYLPSLKGCLVFLACRGRKLILQLNNTVWSLQYSNGGQKPPVQQRHVPAHTLPRMPACRGGHDCPVTSTRLRGTSRPLLATLPHCRLLWNLLVPDSLRKWIYHFL